MNTKAQEACADPTDRASLESDRAFLLRMRDRERKLLEQNRRGLCPDRRRHLWPVRGMRRRHRDRAAQGAAGDHALHHLQVGAGSARATRLGPLSRHRRAPPAGAQLSAGIPVDYPAYTPTPEASMKVRKAVVVAAGLGTRMLPATRVIPKEILPVVDTPRDSGGGRRSDCLGHRGNRHRGRARDARWCSTISRRFLTWNAIFRSAASTTCSPWSAR